MGQLMVEMGESNDKGREDRENSGKWSFEGKTKKQTEISR